MARVCDWLLTTTQFAMSDIDDNLRRHSACDKCRKSDRPRLPMKITVNSPLKGSESSDVPAKLPAVLDV